MKKLLFAFLVVVQLINNGQAQNETDPQGDKIELIAKVEKESIKLRWMPSNPVAWSLLNKYGYKLVRYTITRDSTVLPVPEELTLGDHLAPDEMHKWESYIDEDDDMAVLAQAIYGETFEVDYNKSDIMQIVNKTREDELRFSFASFVADRSYLGALRAGLAFKDLVAKPNEKYLYRIYSLIPEEVLAVDFGFIYTGLSEYKTLPAPVDFEAEFSDKSVLLKWNSELYDRLYNSYVIEKSIDGKNFKSITKSPIINTYSANEQKSRYMFKTDSLSENGIEVFYRLRGLDAFGEISPSSELVKGIGKESFNLEIGIISGVVSEQQSVTINWNVITEVDYLIKEFNVERSNSADGPFTIVNKEPIDKGLATYIDLKPLSTNYYKISATSVYGDVKSSYPYLVQLQDSIPPSIPIKVIGSIDSLGIVNISWQPNTEEDLLGYRVYRSNFKNSEFGQITNEPVKSPFFIDTVSINTLTSSIYYKVLAVDNRFNPSDPSKEVALRRPDIIPPTAPVFKSIKSVQEGIAIEWINSSSADVAAHIIYKKKEGENNWSLYRTIAQSTTQNLVDSDVIPGVYYNYTLIALDSSNLESVPAKSVRGIKIDTGVRSKIEKITTNVDRTNRSISLKWEYDKEGVKNYLIYKSTNEERLSLYNSIENEKKFIDKTIRINSTYTYRIKATFTDGSESAFSDPIVVTY